MELRIKSTFTEFGSKAIIFNDLVVIDKPVVEIVVLVVKQCVVLFGMFRLLGLTFGCVLVFVFLIVFSFLCSSILMPPVLLDRSKIAFDLNTSKHGLDQVLKAMPADVSNL